MIQSVGAAWIAYTCLMQDTVACYTMAMACIGLNEYTLRFPVEMEQLSLNKAVRLADTLRTAVISTCNRQCKFYEGVGRYLQQSLAWVVAPLAVVKPGAHF